MMIIIWLILAAVVLWFVFGYNGLVTLRTRSDEAWSDIEVQMKRRYDLIPNLINTVKGYAAHESVTFDKVSQARSAAMGAGSLAERGAAENMLSGALKSLFAVAEAYPELKANQNFLALQTELSDTENKIQAARRFYNGNVRDLAIKIDTFPSNLVASLFHFTKKEFFQLDAAEEAAASKPVEVNFKQGFAVLPVIIIILILAAAGTWYFSQKTATPSVAQPPVTTAPPGFIPPTTPPPSTSDVEETANWKTYTNDKYGFSFKYPANWVSSERDFFEGTLKTGYQIHFASSELDLDSFPVFHDFNLDFVIKDTSPLSFKNNEGLMRFYNLGRGPSMQFPSNPTSVSVNGVDAIRGETTIAQGITAEHLGLVRNGEWIEMGFYSHLEKDKSKQLFDQILSTFHFTP